MLKKQNRKKVLYIVFALLITIGLSVGFSAFQKDLKVEDLLMHIRLQREIRVSNKTIQTASNATSNVEDYNVSKIYGNVTFDSTAGYILYKVSLTNYGNVKMGLLDINSNTSGVNYSLCNSSGNSCTTDFKTAICEGNNCTLGSTKDIYVKVTANSTGAKNIDLDLDFQPYNDITYDNVRESTNSFPTEIMSTDSFTITLTSKPEEVEVTGTATVNYNKNTGVLTVSNVGSDLTIQARYLLTSIAETTYTGSDPDNYVSFNNTLYRIITKETVDDGYGNEELRAKIISNASIGQYQFDNNGNYHFDSSTLRNTLNTTYYNSLSETAQGLIDTSSWSFADYGEEDPETDDPVLYHFTDYFALIVKDDYNSNSSWLNQNQFTMDCDFALGAKKVLIVENGAISYTTSDGQKNVYPVVHLNKDVLVVGGSGTQASPYLLELSSNGLQPNPTEIEGRSLTVTGSNQQLITVSNQVGTPYYSTSTRLTSANYSSAGSTTIPTASEVGNYRIYYYIPAFENIKAKSGAVSSRISGIKYTISYAIGSNVNSIGKESDECTTSGSNLSCSVTLPTITPNAGYGNGKWSDGTNLYDPGTSYTLSGNGTTLTAQVSGNTYTATFYYWNGSAIATKTAQCIVSGGSTCNVTLPTGINSSTGQYGGTYKGVTTDLNSMGTTNLTLSGNANYYANYSKAVSIYRPTSMSTSSRITVYRNECFSSTNAIGSIIAVTNDSTTKITSIDGLWSEATFVGYALSQNTYVVASGLTTVSDSIANKTEATYYAIGTYNANVTATFYYSKDTSGTVASVTASGNQERYIYVESTGEGNAVSQIKTNGTITAPTLTGETAPAGTTSVNGFATTYSNMNTTTTYNTGTTKYYKVYSDTVTIYKPTTTTTCNSTNTVFYRNSFINVQTPTVNTTKYSKSLSTTNTVTTDNAGYSPGVTGYSFLGFTTTTSSNTVTYSNLSELKASSDTTVYAILQKNENVTVTFYYSKDTTGTVGSASSSGTRITTLSCTSNSEANANVSNSSITAPTLTGETAPVGTTRVSGFASENTSMLTTTTYSTENTSYYAVYSNTLMFYIATSYDTAGSVNEYRNAFIDVANPTVNTTKYTVKISKTNTGTTDIIRIDELWTGARFAEYSLTVNTYNPETDLTTIADSIKSRSETTYYVIALVYLKTQVNFYYSNSSDGNRTSVMKYAAHYNYVYCTSTTVANYRVVKSYDDFTPPELDDEVAPTGTTSVGWSSGRTSMNIVTPAGSRTSYYKVYSQEITIYRPTSDSSVSSTTVYRNAYYGTDSNYTQKISSSATETADINSVPGMWGNLTFAGYSTTVNSFTATSGLTTVANSIKYRSETTYYAIGNRNEEVTFHYNSNTTSGSFTDATTTSSVTSKYYCSSNTTVGVGHGTTSTVPSVVTGSVGKYNSPYIGISNRSGGITSTSTFTGGQVYYAYYSQPLTIYYPNTSDGVSSSNTALYRNEYYSSATDMIAVTSNSQTNSDISSQATTVTLSNIKGTFVGLNASANSATYYAISDSTIKNSATSAFYAVTTFSENATFHYNSNATSGSFTDATATQSVTSRYYCTSTTAQGTLHGSTTTVPTAVSGSVGKYNSTYKGISSSSTGITNVTSFNGGSTYYAYYSKALTIYYPNTSNGISNSSTALYRNEYYNSASTMNTITATSQTSTTQATSITLNNLKGTLLGLNASANSTTYYAINSDTIKNTNTSTYYAVTTFSENATFHYNSNTTSGSFTDATATQSVTSRYYCTSTTAQGTWHGSTTTVPSAVSSSVGKYNSAYKGLSSSSSSISNATSFTGGQTYYAYYSSPVTIYYPDTTSTRDNTVYHRNEYYNSNSIMNTVLGSSDTSTSNVSFTSSISGYSLYGFANSANTNTRDYVSVETLAASNKTTSYAILYDNVTATFYYNSDTTAGGFNAGTITGSANKYIRCTSSAAELINSNISVPSVVSDSVGKQNSTYKSVSSSLSNMNSINSTTANTTYYANYSEPVINYYYDSGYTSRTLYRNEFFTSNSAISTKLAATNTSTTNYSSASGPGSSGWDGLSTELDTSSEYASIQAAADSTTTTLYTTYMFGVTYAIGSNVSAIGSTSGSCSVTTGSTSCNVVLPTITPNAGYTSNGWNTTSGATTGAAEESNYALSSNGITLYANASIMYRCPTSRTATNISWGSYSTSMYGSYQDLCESRYGQNSECGKTATGTQTSYHCSNTGGCTFVTGCCSCGYENEGGYRCTDTIYTTNTCTSYRCPNSLTWNYTFGDPQPAMYGDYQSQCVPYTSDPLYQCPISGTEIYSDYGGKATSAYGSYQTHCVVTTEQNTLCGTSQSGTHMELHWNAVCTRGDVISCSLTDLSNCSSGAASCYWCNCRDYVANTCTLYNCPNTMTYGSPWTFGDWQTSRYGSYQSNCRSNQL